MQLQGKALQQAIAKRFCLMSDIMVCSITFNFSFADLLLLGLFDGTSGT
jgi:hypothetical protein